MDEWQLQSVLEMLQVIKTAVKDISNLKAAHLDKKAKELIAIIRENPYRTPPSYKKLVGNLDRSMIRKAEERGISKALD